MAFFAAEGDKETLSSTMTFSICIPNYNYAHYLGRTFESIGNLDHEDFEVVVSDNASTDGSLEVIKECGKGFRRFKYQVNPINLGFSPNLDKAAALATAEYLIMLSSDDLIEPQALSVYEKVVELHPGAAVGSAWDIIDSNGSKTGRTGPNPKIWKGEDLDSNLSALLECDVYRMPGNELLKRCLLNMETPFNFCTAAYPRPAYVGVGGYGGSRMINPDKWFHWRLLTEVPEAIYVDSSLFNYRWHNQNQTAQQLNTGHLKYIVDEYRNTIEITDEMLALANIKRAEFIWSFVKNDICRHGMGEFSRGRWLKALRILFFGLATYPVVTVFNRYFLPFVLLLCTTPLGSYLVSVVSGQRQRQ